VSSGLKFSLSSLNIPLSSSLCESAVYAQIIHLYLILTPPKKQLTQTGFSWGFPALSLAQIRNYGYFFFNHPKRANPLPRRAQPLLLLFRSNPPTEGGGVSLMPGTRLDMDLMDLETKPQVDVF